MSLVNTNHTDIWAIIWITLVHNDVMWLQPIQSYFPLSFSEYCPDRLGFPAISLPHSGVTSVHLLPQVVFNCPGSIKSVTFFADNTYSKLTLGILQWMDNAMDQAEILYTFTLDVSQAGEQTVTLSPDGIMVKKGDFVAIYADEQNLCPIKYMMDSDVTYLGNHAELVFTNSNLNAFSVGTLIANINTDWNEERKVFAVSFQLENYSMTTTKGTVYCLNCIDILFRTHKKENCF